MEQYYSLSDASGKLGIKVRTARQWLRDGKLKAVKYPGSNRWYVSAEEIIRIRGEYANGNENREHS